MTFDFTQQLPQEPIISQGSLPFTRSLSLFAPVTFEVKVVFLILIPLCDFVFVCFRTGRCHGVALWMEYHLTDDITVSTGLIRPVSEQVSVVTVVSRL